MKHYIQVQANNPEDVKQMARELTASFQHSPHYQSEPSELDVLDTTAEPVQTLQKTETNTDLEQELKERLTTWADSYKKQNTYTQGKIIGAMHALKTLKQIQNQGEKFEDPRSNHNLKNKPENKEFEKPTDGTKPGPTK